jgi:hypothetical protein
MGSQGIYMNGSNVYEVDFDVDACGNLDKYHPRSKLGWALGFRDASYVMTGNNIYADSLVNINTVRYVYLVVDEYNNSFPNSFVSPMNQFIMNRKILARLCIDNAIHPFGSVVYGNETNGAIVSDRRTYSGKIDIQRLNVQLVNEWGLPINLNGLDFSFCLELEYE